MNMIRSARSWRPLFLFVLAAALYLGGSLLVQAARVKVWAHHAASHFDKARFQNAVVSNEGTLRLSRQLRPLASIDAAHVWAVVEDRDGNLLAATGDEGKIFKVAPDGKTSIVFGGDSD